ncbi:MAG: YdhR family protein [Planctomycetota bacterium]|nr:YdhR family protein [Planctomycetota bacterium]
MHLMIVNFKLNGMTRQEYDALLEEVGPAFPAVAGLQSKYYLADDAANTYGGVYIWESRQAMLDFQASEMFQGVKEHPGFTDFTVNDFDVIAEPTCVNG